MIYYTPYTEIMERDEHFFDKVYTSDADSTDWLTDVRFVLDKEEICRGCIHHANALPQVGK